MRSAKGLATTKPFPSVRDKLEHFLLISITPIGNTGASLIQPLVGSHLVRIYLVQNFLVGLILTLIQFCVIVCV